VIVTPRARGGIPEPHPLAFGVLGDESASAAVLGRADLIVTLGLDPAETGAALWSAPTLRLARSPARDTCMAPTREIVGDIGLVLEELAPRLRGRARADWDVAELDRLRRTARSSEASDPLYAAVESVVRMTREITPSGAIAVFEAALAPSSRRWQCVAPGDLIVPTLPAFSGFAVPAAIAASLSSPDAPVLCFTDAAGFRDATPDLETAKSVDAGIVVIVMNERAEKLARDVVRVSPDGAWSEVLDRAASARHPIVVEVALER
jgi:acetolactate synthase-1/2/3 large subunit